jgi:homoserine kinase
MTQVQNLPSQSYSGGVNPLVQLLDHPLAIDSLGHWKSKNINMTVFEHLNQTHPHQVMVKVPATTANLGPGFDCIGAALNLYNCFHFSLPTSRSTPTLTIIANGVGAERVAIDASNLVYRSFASFFQQLGKTPPPVVITIHMSIPLARGLGSSATAIVGGIMAANHLMHSPFSQADVMQLAIALEGHPDNVVPALVGGCQLATTINPTSNPSHLITPISWHPSLTPIIAIPDFELSTQAARQVLPLQYPREDVIFNTSHLGLLIRALETKNPEWLRIALADRIHQPYRQALIPGYEQVHGAAIAAGAYGVVISGAGPSLLALVDQSQAAGVILAMEQAWLEVGLTSTVQAMTLDQGGATLIEPVHPMA